MGIKNLDGNKQQQHTCIVKKRLYEFIWEVACWADVIILLPPAGQLKKEQGKRNSSEWFFWQWISPLFLRWQMNNN